MRLAVVTALLLSASFAGCRREDQENIADRAIAVAAPAAEAAALAPAPQPGPAPADFQAELETVVRPFEGDVGVAVKDLREGWAAVWQGDKLFPQQSSMKVWLAVAVLDAVDRGEMRLDQPVVMTPEDLSVFNQPSRPLILDDGRWDTTVDELLRWSLAKSDNGATDMLMRMAGGEAAVQQVLQRKGLRGLRTGPEERVLQPRISGLEWRPEYRDGDLFNRARDRVPDSVRDVSLANYLRAPPDGATPVATVQALEALAAGKLLSPGSTQHLLAIMSGGRAGGARLKAALPKPDGGGWRVAHKTGTGPDWRRVNAGFNDVGVMFAPDGRAYAVAVYIGRTERSVTERQKLIADVARLVVARWEAQQPPPAAQVAATPVPATP